MKRLFIYIAAVAMAMSCTEDITETLEMEGSAETTFVTLNLDIEGGTSDTRVSVTPGENATDPWKTAWEEGDQVCVSSVKYGGYKVLTYSADSGFSGEVYLGENRIYYNSFPALDYGYGYVDDSWEYMYSYVLTYFSYLSFADGGVPLMVSSEVITVGSSDDDSDGVVTDVIDVTMQHIGTAIDFGMKFKNIPDGILTPKLTKITLGGVPEGGEESDYTSVTSRGYTDFYKGVDDDGFIIEDENFYSDYFTASIPITESDTEYSLQFGCYPFTIEAGKKINVTLEFNDGLVERSFDITNSGEAFTFARATHSTFQNSYDLTGFFDDLPDAWLFSAIEFADTTSTGTAEDPIEIASAEELAYLSAIAYGLIPDTTTEGVYYELTQDINLEGKEWTPIGASDSPFMGHFDGGNNTISNLTITATEDNYQGLFGYVGDISQDTYYASISNLTMASVNINNSSIGYIGGVAGVARYTTISNCSVSGTIYSNKYIGGVVGLASYCDITGCSSAATVTSSDTYIGGIAGNASYTDISECYNTGDVGSIDISSRAGGIAGAASGSITNCYNTGKICGKVGVGGVVGVDVSAYDLYITSCYNTGVLSGYTYTGGIIGQSLYGISYVTSCFNVGEVTETGSYTNGHILGGIMGASKDSYDGIVTESYYIVSGDTTEFNNSGTQLTSAVELNEKVDDMNTAANTALSTSGVEYFTEGSDSKTLPMLGIGGAEPITYDPPIFFFLPNLYGTAGTEYKTAIYTEGTYYFVWDNTSTAANLTYYATNTVMDDLYEEFTGWTYSANYSNLTESSTGIAELHESWIFFEGQDLTPYATDYDLYAVFYMSNRYVKYTSEGKPVTNLTPYYSTDFSDFSSDTPSLESGTWKPLDGDENVTFTLYSSTGAATVAPYLPCPGDQNLLDDSSYYTGTADPLKSIKNSAYSWEVSNCIEVRMKLNNFVDATNFSLALQLKSDGCTGVAGTSANFTGGGRPGIFCLGGVYMYAESTEE